MIPDSIEIATGASRHAIYFSALDDVPRLLTERGLRPGRCIIISDDTVADLYAERLLAPLRRQRWSPKVIAVPPGEASKSLDPLSALYDEILTSGIDRKTPVLALGGGVVGDLAGFAAATLLRGVPLVQIPTTVIAQVDSSIGGKTGINHEVGKNLIGAFYQPLFVATDPELLRTLPDREWFSGMSEVVKHALIADLDFAKWLLSRWSNIQNRDAATVDELVRRAALIKVRIVEEDFMEHGQRALLNFGHTFGHAIERTAGYGSFTHGEAVAVGMRAAVYLSAKLHPHSDFSTARSLIDRLPVEGDLSGLSTVRLMDAMQYDKKMDAGTLRLIILEQVGSAAIVEAVEPQQIEEAWNHAKSA